MADTCIVSFIKKKEKKKTILVMSSPAMNMLLIVVNYQVCNDPSSWSMFMASALLFIFYLCKL
jgi:hypothetical protein